MRLEVFHQLGFRHKWNFQSLAKDKTGDGVILGPRYLEREEVENLPPSDREFSIFDPQFFLPRTPKGHLSTYDFFPDVVAQGFSTAEFATSSEPDEPTAAATSAHGCVSFQVRNGFRYVVIPTRRMEGLPGDFIDRQMELFVAPFLAALRDEPQHKPVLLQLVLNDLMLKDEAYRAELLNWVTGIPELAGVYLIVEVSNRRTKQIKDMDLLYAMLRFTDALVRNRMEVCIGYTNTEALLLSIASPKIVTIGCYENMRTFIIRTFQEEDESEMQGPTARIYVSKLLQWVDHRYRQFILDELPTAARDTFFDQNEYQALMFQPTFNWHFAKSELYKHALLEFWKQLRAAGDLEGKQRYEQICNVMATARDWYGQLQGIEFDSHSDGSHLPLWLTVAHRFAKDKGWR